MRASPNQRLQLTGDAHLRVYLWIHIAAGWFFSTMFVLGITGMVRR